MRNELDISGYNTHNSQREQIEKTDQETHAAQLFFKS